jgi:hypothetical protein
LSPAVLVVNVTVAPVIVCVPVHVFVALFKLVSAVPTNAVDAELVELSPAVAVGTVIVAPVKLCVPVHVSPLITLSIDVFTNAVDAASVVFVPAAFVDTVTVAPVIV